MYRRVGGTGLGGQRAISKTSKEGNGGKQGEYIELKPKQGGGKALTMEHCTEGQ